MRKLSFNHAQKKSGGYLLMDLVVSIAIIIILATITTISLSSYTQAQALNNGVDDVLALLNEAHSRTVSADGGTTYGVHFDTDAATLFAGTTYTPGAAGNQVVTLDSHIEISMISLSSGESDVLFNVLTGDTDDDGTILMQRISSTDGEKTLTISKTGEVSSS